MEALFDNEDVCESHISRLIIQALTEYTVGLRDRSIPTD